MTEKNSSFGAIAESYDVKMGEKGDLTHEFGIDPVLFNMIGEVSKKKIYDIGCGNGYVDRILAEKGATKIFASDISSELIEIAKQKPHTNIEYFTSDGQDFNNFSTNDFESFDLVISNMAVHYIKNIEQLAVDVSKLLKKSGKFIFTVSHPINDLYLDSKNNVFNRDKISEVVKNFASPFEEKLRWGEMELYIQKRSISYYINTINKAGFVLESFQEISKINQEGDQILDTKIPQSMAFCFIKR